MKRHISIEGAFEAEFTENDLPLSVGGKGAAIVLPGIDAVQGHFAQSRGHLFFQPEVAVEAVFHNNESVTASVWVKSGDTLRIGQWLLQCSISGDWLEIRISDARAAKQLTPPPLEDLQTGTLPKVAGNNAGKLKKKKVRFIAAAMLILLLLLAGFVLLGKQVKVEVTPAPQELVIRGFPPVVRVGHVFFGLPGTYTLEASLPGYVPLQRDLIISPENNQQHQFIFEKEPAFYTIESTPQGAKVLLDAQSVGATPLVSLPVKPGTHTLRLHLDGYLPLQQDIEVDGLGKKHNLSFTLDPATANILIETTPQGAQLSLNETVHGLTPLQLTLNQGQHDLHLSKELYKKKDVLLDVTAGQDRHEQYILEPLPGRVKIISRPKGASVNAGDRYLGQTPLQIELEANKEHQLFIGLRGYSTVKKTLSLEPDADEAVNVSLIPALGTLFISVTPPNAVLQVDGKMTSLEDGRLQLQAGEHVLHFSLAGYEDAVHKVRVQQEQAGQLVVTLVKKGEDRKPPQAVTSDIGFIRMQPTPFLMGASRSEAGRRANEQERKIILQRRFLISAREVSNKGFRRFRPGHDSGSIDGQSLNGNEQPVVAVSWQDAARYANWMSKQAGLPLFYKDENNTLTAALPANTGYRLPTEAEWAYAARMAGREKRARYPWPGSYPPVAVSGNYGDQAAASILPVVIPSYNDGFAVTAPIASFAKNQAGIFDLGGNVSEWCHDYYTPYAGLNLQEAHDPLGPAQGKHHVVRGSSWRDATITELRLSYRGYGQKKRDDIGFRLARYIQ